MSSLVRVDEHLAINRAFKMREFNDLLEKAMVREGKETKKVSFAPSGLGYAGKCPRYWYYAFNGAYFEYSSDAPAVANMNAGTDSGARLAKMLDTAGILVDDEVEVNTIGHETFPPIRGYIDAIINWQGEELLVEVKTTKSTTWQYRVNGHMVPGYQLLQLLIYMYVTDHEKGMFLTENKDTHEIFVLPIKMTAERKAMVESVFKWMHKVKENADNGELPLRPFNKSSLECKGCAVRNTCWEGWTRGKVNGKDPNPGQVDLPPLEVPK